MREYHKKCYDFGLRFMRGFSEYLGYEYKKIIYFPLHEEYNETRRLNIVGAGSLDKNGFFNFGAIFTITPEDQLPQARFIIKLFYKFIEDFVIIKFKDDDDENKIKENDDTKITEIYDKLFLNIKDILRNRFDNFMKKQVNKNNPIGFSN
jgi:hypothetical protein